jgi:quinol monooxygenase YgiN
MNAMIWMNLKIIPLPDRTEELIRALRLQMGRTQVQPGCLHCQIHQDADQPNVVIYHEQWKSWTDIERHIGSDRFAWILELMELSCNTPDLQFCDVNETRGMEYVRRIRKAKSN